ncbi:MAG: lysylphosphatidylglycerol synthase transmembrane domain-containing protein [Candidatus Aenigmatarchaeota archaeon]
MLKRYRFLLLGISIAILAAIVWYSNPAALVSLLYTADMKWIVIAFIISNISICLRVLKWKVLLKNVGFRELYPVQILGMTISNFTPGKLGEPIKAIILKMRKGLAVSETLPSIMWERIMDIAILIIFSIVALQFISLDSRFFLISLISVGIFSSVILTLSIIIYSRKIGVRFFAFFKKFPFLNKVSDNFIETFYSSKIKKRGIFKCLILTIFPWLFEGVILYLSFLAFGITTNPLVLAGIVALSVLIGVASFLPGGMGSADVAMIFILGMTGLGNTVTVAAVLLYRFLSLWYGILIGGLSFVYLSRKMDLKKILD